MRNRLAPMAIALAAFVVGGAWDASGASVRVKASEVASPCVAATTAAFRDATGHGLVVETVTLGPAHSGDGADVVVGAAEEMTRVLEGGQASLDSFVRLARIPWVLVGGRDGHGEGVTALAKLRPPLYVPRGPLGHVARRALQARGQARALSLGSGRDGATLVDGATAFVPVSLAGGQVAAPVADMRPVELQAVAMADSGRLAAARAFLAFVSRGPGNQAFGECGRARGSGE